MLGISFFLGISESERERRKQNNILTTKINFLAWLIEVPQTFCTQKSLIELLKTFWIQTLFVLQLVGLITLFFFQLVGLITLFFLPACGADNSNYFCSQPCVASPVENDHSPSSHEHCRAALLHRCCRKGEVEESEVALFSAEQCPPGWTPDVPRDGITPSRTGWDGIWSEHQVLIPTTILEDNLEM